MKNSILSCITVYHYLIISIILFLIGLIGFVISRNFIKILISLEFILNSVNILFISFASYRADSSYLGYTIVLFSTAISALVLAIGLYMTYQIYQKFGTIDVVKVYDKYKEINKC